MTFRKGHKRYYGGEKYDEKTGEVKDIPPSPVTLQDDTASNQPNQKSPNNFSTKNSPNNFSSKISPNKPNQIIWRAHPGPQTSFHNSQAYEMLFGGTKGPGKTDTLLREGLRQIHIPTFKAIIFRRTYPNLREVIDRSHKYFPGMGAKFNSQDHRWTFPSGAIYGFGHIQHEHDKWNYNGFEYHYIGFDEVTEFTETQYLFIMAQNRTSDSRIRCYIRSTANPGGVGHGWVKKRFIDVLKPCELKYFKKVEDDDIECLANDPHAVSREFIPATVYDNPSITENDPNYIKRLEQLPEEDKQALLYGNWDIFKGQFFKAWRRSIHVKERSVEKGFNKFISLDYGYAAPSAVGWWMVDFDGVLHMYRELYKEGLTYTMLAEKIMEMTPDEEKIDYAVADPAIWGDKSHHGKDGIKGESGGETMQVMWSKFTALIKADNSRIIGWGRMREMMEPKQMPDGSFVSKLTVSPDCRDFIRTVPSMIHDDKKVEDCNCFVAGTLVQTPEGFKNIEEFNYGDIVCTPIGNQKVIKSGVSGYSDVWRVDFSDGRFLEGTEDHKIFIEGKGLVAIKSLLEYYIPKERNISCEKKLSLMVSSSLREKVEGITSRMERFFQKGTQIFIERFGNLLMERFQRVMLFITKTMTEIITPLRILSLSPERSIVNYTIRKEKKPFLNHYQSGEVPSLEKRHYNQTQEKCLRTDPSENFRVLIVEKLLEHSISNKTLAQRSAGLSTVLHSIKLVVRYVARSLDSKRTGQEQPRPVHISAVGFSGRKEKVYNLTVEKAHLYYANGFLVTNSDGEDHMADQGRYSVMSRIETPDRLVNMPFNQIVHKIFDPFQKEDPPPEFDSGGVYHS